jgi:hypothetical protein
MLGAGGSDSAGDEALRSASGVSRQEPWLSEPCYAQRGSHYGVQVADGSARCMTIFTRRRMRGRRSVGCGCGLCLPWESGWAVAVTMLDTQN